MRNEKFIKLAGLLIEPVKVKVMREVLSMGGDECVC